jgi:uncharacterized protein (DUF1810 family)
LTKGWKRLSILQTMNVSPAEFDHFLEAQRPVYDQVVEELAHGQKRSHWMWFIFPQIKGLGRSATSERFAIQSLEQARRYASHVPLGQRLRECTRLVLGVRNRTVSEIFGYPDDLKFHSSMTLFAMAAPDEPLFHIALEKYFAGEWDAKTLEILGTIE